MTRSGELTTLPFTKLHAAKNDFVLIEADRFTNLRLDQIALALADRHAGVGFDQLMVITADARASSGLGYLVFNADGSSAQQCGNGARALASWLVRHRGLKPPFQLRAPNEIVEVIWDPHFGLGVALGKPNFDPQSLPMLLEASPRYTLSFGARAIEFSALSIGNPHITLLVDDLGRAEVSTIGSALQQHESFPERVNVGFCQVLGRGAIRLRVYERGAGETLACGSGACAAVVNTIRLGLCDRSVRVHMPGGELAVVWPDDAASVSLFGPVCEVFQGQMAIADAWHKELT